MKTFSQFIEEAKKAKPPEEVLNKISRAYGKKHRGVNLDTSHSSSGDIRLNNIWLPPEKRNQGIGSRIMKGLSSYADRQGKRITLNQAPEKGKKQKLANFYRSHGFVPNKGRNKDFTTRDTHIRNPKT
jgi:GNAT superfamily N-acetyltransferase